MANNDKFQGKQDLPSQRQEKMGEQLKNSQQVGNQQAQKSSDMAGKPPKQDQELERDQQSQGQPGKAAPRKQNEVKQDRDLSSNDGRDIVSPDETNDQDAQVTGRHPSQADRDDEK